MPVPYTSVRGENPAPSFQLTVITVCWNALADLKPTVASVLRQKARGSISIEHLVVDGASTDGTPAWLAEQLAAGNIERYVSEPDRGIYDAMNKGINLARGRVLAFLNAGDWYAEDVDLAECVLQICRGETESVAAVAYFENNPDFPLHRPDFRQHIHHTPCCHQAYFASARAYRRIGGYDAPHFKCSADADMMCKMYYAFGEPLISGLKVVHFDTGGLSRNGNIEYIDEHIEILWRNWERVKEKCRRDPEYRGMVQAVLCDHCFNLQNWQETHGHAIPEALEHLATMCMEAADMAGFSMARAALSHLGRRYLPRLLARTPLPRGTRQRLTLCQCLCHPAANNRYTVGKPIRGGSLWACAYGKIRNSLKRILRPRRRMHSHNGSSADDAR